MNGGCHPIAHIRVVVVTVKFVPKADSDKYPYIIHLFNLHNPHLMTPVYRCKTESHLHLLKQMHCRQL